MGIAELIESDKRVKKLKKMLEGGSFALDTDLRIKEMLTQHKLRAIRRLETRHVIEHFQEKVITARLENQTTRSRIVEIHTECFIITARLNKHLGRLRKYLMAKYSEQLKKYATTITDRKNVIDSILEDALERKEELEQVSTIAKSLIDDIDNSSWVFRDIIETMQIVTEKRLKKI